MSEEAQQILFIYLVPVASAVLISTLLFLVIYLDYRDRVRRYPDNGRVLYEAQTRLKQEFNFIRWGLAHVFTWPVIWVPFLFGMVRDLYKANKAVKEKRDE